MKYDILITKMPGYNKKQFILLILIFASDRFIKYLPAIEYKANINYNEQISGAIVKYRTSVRVM